MAYQTSNAQVEQKILSYLHSHKLSKPQEEVTFLHGQDSFLYTSVVRTWLENRVLEHRRKPSQGPERHGDLHPDIMILKIERPRDWEDQTAEISLESHRGVERCSDCRGERLRCSNSQCHEGKLTCSYCSGAKNVLCQSCSGSALLTCSDCKGRYRTPCPDCHRAGRPDCYTCSGTGNLLCNYCKEGKNPCECHSGRIRCEECEATGHVLCPDCQGSAYRTCPTCQGAAFVAIIPTVIVKWSSHLDRKIYHNGTDADPRVFEQVSWDTLQKATPVEDSDSFTISRNGRLDTSGFASVVSQERRHIAEWLVGAVDKYQDRCVIKQTAFVRRYPVRPISFTVTHLFRKAETHPLWTIGTNSEIINPDPPSSGNCNVM